jgi:hypothetical protein
MSPSDLLIKIEAGLKWARENEFKIVRERSGIRDRKYCCPLGAAYWADNGTCNDPNVFTIVSHFERDGLTADNALAFIEGFDGIMPVDSDEFTKLGLDLSEQLKPETL